VKFILERWNCAAKIPSGTIFWRVKQVGSVWAAGVTEKVAWHVVRECAAAVGSQAWHLTI
jgi:hypothetical protein